MIYVTENEVAENLTVKDLIPVMKDAFLKIRQDMASYATRNRLLLQNVMLSTMPAMMIKPNIAGLKTYITGKGKSFFVVLLFDLSEMRLKAVLEANKLGQLRTGAVPAMVSREIVKKKEINFSLIGTGFQAESQLAGIASVFHVREAKIYSRNREHVKNFVESAQKIYDFPITGMESASQCLENADIITCVTNTETPLFTSDDLPDSFHINLVGGNVPMRREVGDDVLDISDLIILEDRRQALLESGEIMSYSKKNSGKFVEISDVLSNTEILSNKKRTVLKTMGIGLEDIAAADYLLHKISH